MKPTNIAKIALLLLAMAILAQPILALGLSPARTIIDFEPGLRKSVTIKIMNNEHKDFNAFVYIRGELANYTDIKETLITITQHDDYKELTYEVILPKELEKPGIHKSELVVIEFPKEIIEFPKEIATGGQTFITSATAIASELRLRVPYPGKYAEAQLHISGDIKDGIRFVMPVFNYGKEEIKSAKAKIKIVGATYEEIAVLETNEIPIAASKEGKLAAVWKPEKANPGRYQAMVEIVYDGKAIRLEKNFDMGDLLIDIEDIKVSDFKLGSIARFDINLQSKWNEPIDNVYAEVAVSDKGQQLHSFKTAPVSMPALEDGRLEAYWDTKGIEVGAYNVNVTLHYAEKITARLFEINVNIDSIRTGLTAEVIAGEGSYGKNTILVTLVLIMIIINIGWLIYIKKIKRK